MDEKVKQLSIELKAAQQRAAINIESCKATTAKLKKLAAIAGIVIFIVGYLMGKYITFSVKS